MTDFVSDLYEALISQYLARPEADQEPYYSVSDSLRLYADSLWSDTGEANKAVQRLLSSGRGEAMDAMGQQWDKVMNKDVGSTTAVARMSAVTAYELGEIIAVAKAEITEVAASCAVSTGARLAGGALVFGVADDVVATAVAQAQALALKVVARCQKLVVAKLGRLQQDPAVAALGSVAADLAAAIGGQARDGAADAGTGRAWGKGLASGSGRAAEGVHVDHAEHERAAKRLREVADEVFGTTSTTLRKAVHDHATGAQSGALGAAIAATFGTVLDDLTQATKAIGDYLEDTLPAGILLISSSQQSTDDDVRRRMSELDR
ncbi:hypothetical protein ACFXGT_23835 [Streptomyces sp. NPDC059352]|uniref:hypothetical protein n=1 Tax=Streptomyces sp. NPDC059352 TaxID=3346810 RepID=UPI0036D0118C